MNASTVQPITAPNRQATIRRRRVFLRGRRVPRALGPLFVEVHPPAAFLVLLELELGAEAAAGAAAEARDLLRGPAHARILAALARLAQALDQLLDHRRVESL